MRLSRICIDFHAALWYSDTRSKGRQKGGRMPTMETVKIGRRLRALREESLMTQAELGEAAKVSRDQVSRIERDEVDPRFRTIRKLADALGVDPRELTKG
jgi:DNA-binding XRE family transcriptional regulator